MAHLNACSNEINWHDAFPHLIHRLRTFSNKIDPKADTLIVAPYRGIMQAYEPRELLSTNIHNASTYPDTPAGRLNADFLKLIDREHQNGAAYHISDERTVEQNGQREHDLLRIGHCLYRNVILAEGASLNPAAQKTIAGLRTAPRLDPARSMTIPPSPTNVHYVKWKLLPGTLNCLVLEPQPLGDLLFLHTFTPHMLWIFNSLSQIP